MSSAWVILQQLGLSSFYDGKYFISSLLSKNQGCFVADVSVEVMQASTSAEFFPIGEHGSRDKLFGPADIEELLQMPGMDELSYGRKAAKEALVKARAS